MLRNIIKIRVVAIAAIVVITYFLFINTNKNLNNNILNDYKVFNEEVYNRKYFFSNKTNNSIFCIILTTKHNLNTKAKAVHECWAKYCDDVKFLSNFPDEFNIKETNSPNSELTYKNLSLLQPPGMKKDVYSQLPDKIFLSYKYIYQKYNNYDWYLKADDDTWIFMNNLRKFLSLKNSSRPVTYGYDYKIKVENGYHSGGAGYILSNEAMKRLGKKLNEDYSFCQQTDSEDVDVARCLRKMNVLPEKSIDDFGRERFHPLNLMLHYKGKIPEWLYNYSTNINSIKEVTFFLNIANIEKKL
jgi:glycoprotein-N-acetylgalactosamine 3-beta-galactosyltransferase